MHATLLFIVVVSMTAAPAWSQTQNNSTLAPCPEPPYNNGIAELIYHGLDAFHDEMANGVPSLGIPPLDPLGPFPTIPFSIHNDYLQLEGTINDTVVTNLAKYIVCQVTFELGLRQYMYLDLRLDDFNMEGFYDMFGTYTHVIPIYGTGNYTLDAFNSSIRGGATIKYNLITDHASIKDLELDILFDELFLFMECILGCGEMADLVNNHLSELATVLFNAIWETIDPILTQALENGINEILKDINITDFIPDGNSTTDLLSGDYAAEVMMFKVPLFDLLRPTND